MEELEKTPENQEKPKTVWQQTKEGWYDKIPLTVKQLDVIIWVSVGALIVTVIKIFMDAGIL
jgi:hypothetical protein